MIRERGLKQGWVAAQIGVSQVALSRILDGKRDLPASAVPRIAEILNVTNQDVLNALPEPV